MLLNRSTPVIRIQAPEAVEPHAPEPLEVIERLRQRPASIPSKYLFDDRGIQLYDDLRRKNPHFLSHNETKILKQNLSEIADCVGPEACVIEPGSGCGRHIHELVRGLQSPSRYVPIDFSQSRLERGVKRWREEFPKIPVTPVCADFAQPFSLREINYPQRHVFYFPGSRLGSFEDHRADQLLRQFRFRAGIDGGMILGIDLEQPLDVLLPEYDDELGVTAQFNLNVLAHLNERFDANICIDDFRHQVRFEPLQSRIELWLRAVRDTEFYLAGEQFSFQENEAILTDYSYKYNLRTFADRLRRCGWLMRRSWTDPDRMFAIVYAEARPI